MRTIKQSSKYDDFKLDPMNNRLVKERNVDKLVKSITKDDLLADNPLLVRKNGDGWLVIQGQHRLAAAKILGVPFYYMESESAELKHVAMLSREQSGWEGMDFVDMFVRQGKLDYQYIKMILLKGYRLTTALAICLFPDSNRTQAHIEIKDGIFKVNIAKTNKTLEFLEGFNKFSHYKDRSFVQAVLDMWRNKDYDHKQMLRKLEYTEIERRACKVDYVKQMEEIYNYKSRVRVRFVEV